MKTKKVISTNNLPARLPIYQTLTAWIALDYFNAPQWLWGAIGLFFIILWIVAIITISNQKHIDLFDDKMKKDL